MDNITQVLIELKCQILDVLYVKRLQGMTEVPVSELLEELGMDAQTNLTGLNPEDTIALDSKALDDIEAAKAKIRRSMMH